MHGQFTACSLLSAGVVCYFSPSPPTLPEPLTHSDQKWSSDDRKKMKKELNHTGQEMPLSHIIFYAFQFSSLLDTLLIGMLSDAKAVKSVPEVHNRAQLHLLVHAARPQPAARMVWSPDARLVYQHHYHLHYCYCQYWTN